MEIRRFEENLVRIERKIGKIRMQGKSQRMKSA